MTIIEEAIGLDNISKESVLDEKRKVVLHDNTWNSFEFIINTLTKYVPEMNEDTAEAHAWRINELGTSVIYEGRLEDCRDIVHDINFEKEVNKNSGGYKKAAYTTIEQIKG